MHGAYLNYSNLQMTNNSFYIRKLEFPLVNPIFPYLNHYKDFMKTINSSTTFLDKGKTLSPNVTSFLV